MHSARSTSFEGLPLCCGDKFNTWALLSKSEEFAQAIALAYTGTTDQQRTLKSRMVDLVLGNQGLVAGGNRSFDQLLGTGAEFGVDVIKALVKACQEEAQQKAAAQAELFQTYRCPRSVCAIFNTAIVDDEYYSRPYPDGHPG